MNEALWLYLFTVLGIVGVFTLLLNRLDGIGLVDTFTGVSKEERGYPSHGRHADDVHSETGRHSKGRTHRKAAKDYVLPEQASNFLLTKQMKHSLEGTVSMILNGKTMPPKANTTAPYILVTAGSSNFQSVVLNWIKAIRSHRIEHYIVLCFDRPLLDLVGTKHGILIESHAGLNYSSDSIRRWSEDIWNTTDVAQRKDQHYHEKMRALTPKLVELIRFNVMMLAKYDAIATLLQSSLHVPVIWSDADAVITSPCALDYFLSSPAHVDVVGQRGQSPLAISSATGACLCSGFFMVRPTPGGIALIRTTKSALLTKMSSGDDDQTILNEVLNSWHGFFDRKISFFNSDGYVDYSNNTRHDRSITLGLLPYKQFPRGVHMFLRASKLRQKYQYYIDHPGSRMSGVVFNFHDVLSHSTGAEREDLMLLDYIMDQNNGRIPADSVRHAAEWQRLKTHACVWHRLSKKTGRSKLETMMTDGVWLLNTTGRNKRIMKKAV
jgi:hypothetical protein